MITEEMKQAFGNCVIQYVEKDKDEVIENEVLSRLVCVVREALEVPSRFFKAGYRSSHDNHTLLTHIADNGESVVVTLRFDEYINSVREEYTQTSEFTNASYSYCIVEAVEQLIANNDLEGFFNKDEILEDEAYIVAEYQFIKRNAYSYLESNGYLDNIVDDDITEIVSKYATEVVAVVSD